MSATTPTAAPEFVPAGPPAAQPMRNITDPRILAMLDPRKHGHFRNTGIDKRGSGIAAKSKRQAAI